MTPDTPTRRRFLSRTAVVAGALGFAGCASSGPESSDGGTTDQTGTAGTTSSATSAAAKTEAATTESQRDASFEAPHGAAIEATAYGSGDCGVVLVPQINEDRGSWQPQAEMVAEMGYLALAIDEDPDNRAASVRGAIQYLRAEEDVSTLVLVGASTGGEAVVVANAETDATVHGTIGLSAAGGVGSASDLQGRSLFVVTTNDEDRFVQTAQDLHEAAPKPKTLVEYDGSAHGQGLFESEHGDALRDRLRTFIDEVCGN